jgi:hypothetical protein
MGNQFQFRTSNALGSPIYQYVIDQLTERSAKNSLDKRDDSNLVYLANKSAWFRAVSSIQVSGDLFNYFKSLYNIGDENDLAKKFILFAGTSAYQSNEGNSPFYNLAPNAYENFIKKDANQTNYDEVKEYGYRPFPGITSVQIQTQGKLGSIRAATINFKVWDKQQLDVIDALYFKLGYTVFLEWGNTFYYKYGQNSTNKSEDLSMDPFSADINTKEEVNLQIAKRVRESEGNYDAMLGMITNFNFSFNQEGGYDCSINVQGLGFLGDGLKINHPSKLPNLYIKEIKKFIIDQNQQKIDDRNALIAQRLKADTVDLQNRIDDQKKILNSSIFDNLTNLLINAKQVSFEGNDDIVIRQTSDQQQRIIINKDFAQLADKNIVLARVSNYEKKNTILSSNNKAVGISISSDKDIVYLYTNSQGKDLKKYLDGSQADKIKVTLDYSYLFKISNKKIDDWNNSLKQKSANSSNLYTPVTNVFDYVLDKNGPLTYIPKDQVSAYQLSYSPLTKGSSVYLQGSDLTFTLKSVNYTNYNFLAEALTNEGGTQQEAKIILTLDKNPAIELTITDMSLIKDIEYLPGFNSDLISPVQKEIDKLNQKIAERQKQIESEIINQEPIDSADLDYLSTQAKDATNYESALEIMLKSIEIRALSQAKKIDQVKSPITVDLTKIDKDYTKGFYIDLFSEGIFKDIIQKLVSDQSTPVEDTTYSGIMNKADRFLAQSKYGFNYNLMAGAPPSRIDLVNFKELLKAYVLPYEINSEVEKGIKAQHPVYIQFGLLLMMLNHICLLYDAENINGTPTPMVYLDFNPNTNFCLSNTKQFSTDITKFLIPFQGANSDYFDLFDPEILEKGKDGKRTAKIVGKDYTVFRPDNKEDFIIGKIPYFRYALTTDSKATAYRGAIMNVLVNVNYAADIVKRFSRADGTNAVYLKQLVETILSDMNKSLGNFNMFRLSYRDESNCFVIVDDQQCPVAENEEQLYSSSNTSRIPVFGKNSIARSMELRTEIGSKLGNLIAISANSSVKKQVSMSTDASSFGFINTDFKDRFVKASLDIDQLNKDAKRENNQAQIESAIKFDAHVKSIYSYYNSFSTNAVGAATNYYIQKMSIIKNSEPGSVASAMIPVSLNLSLDGISGIEMTQMFTIDDRFLPINYMKSMNGSPFTSVGFAVVGLNQTIENNQWITSIRTQMNYLKSGPNDYKSVLKERQAASEAKMDLLNGNSESDDAIVSPIPNTYPVTNSSLYGNILFGSGYLGNPKNDNINPDLLKDVNDAAKKAGVVVTITTAITGHEPTPRHSTGNAVDIAIINGQAVSPSNKADAVKFVEQLVLLGYVKNVESGNSRAVLTFGYANHDNHVHVSYRPQV